MLMLDQQKKGFLCCNKL